MGSEILVKEASIEEVVKITPLIIEFGASSPKEYFEERYNAKDPLIIVGYIDGLAVGYLVGYDKFNDGSFYCRMAAVAPEARNRGVLKMLMAYEDQWAKTKGYNKIKIKTRNSRRAMLTYLVKYWFSLTEVVQHADISEHRILLEKSL